MARGAAPALAIALLAALAAGAAGNFHQGDYVPLARRARYHGVRGRRDLRRPPRAPRRRPPPPPPRRSPPSRRPLSLSRPQQYTQWHDVLGAQCPQFGARRAAALALPAPAGFASGDEYRLQLALDGGRVVTPWLRVLGRGAPARPALHVELVRSGDALVAARAVVVALPAGEAVRLGAAAGAEFADAGAWPKQLPVFYTWRARHETDAAAGMAVVFAAAIAATAAAALGVWRAHRRHLRRFVEDVAGEPPAAAAPSPGGGGAFGGGGVYAAAGRSPYAGGGGGPKAD
jgi:hypothetical protein